VFNLEFARLISRRALLRQLCHVLLNSGGFHGRLLTQHARATTTRPLTTYSTEMRQNLAEKILPYWFDTALDRAKGGYALSDDLQGTRPASEKQIVSQSRLIWTFSHVHRKGYSSARRDYLKAAAHGYRFLIGKFLDKANGGYFWTTDLDGNVLNDCKILYGEAFVIYGLLEYYRASNDEEALRHAAELSNHLQAHAYDKKNGGWTEHFTRDWEPILQPTPQAVVGVAGCKSANTHLHLMEALTELFDLTHDHEVRHSLDEVVRLNATYFYPKEVGKSCSLRQSDWKEVVDPKGSGFSYGHNVEFAWLMIHAQKVLGIPAAWDHFYAHLNHALKYGYDHERGGLYSWGEDDKPAVLTDKIWWSQAEMLAALTVALKNDFNPAYETALKKLLDFVAIFMTDPTDGVWLETVTKEGSPKNTSKAHNWKEGYHDVRAIVRFIEAFPPNSDLR
jgi:mannobiose 2-epimerase